MFSKTKNEEKSKDLKKIKESNLETKQKESKVIKISHIVAIVIGIIFVNLSIFHTNVWFDEAYSVGLAKFSFIDIWKIGGNDVHPILYYWLLKIVGLLTGNSILAYRIFSGLAISILGILGFTHIRKDFGEKTGLLFTFLVYFLPETAIYANQIRMYSWAILFVTVLSIYAYRIVKNPSNKNWIIFALASILSIFIHYYGLMAAGIINVCLLIYLIKEKRTKDIIKIVLWGIVQAITYIPWLIYFTKQLSNISKGFWIGFEFPNTLMELLSYQFIGNLNYKVGFLVSVVVYIYVGYLIFKMKKQNKDLIPVKLAIGIYLGVVLAAVIMTAILHTSIVYYRYFFVITGLYIFILSYVLVTEKNKYITLTICAIILVMGIVSNTKLIKENYDESNQKPINYLKENIQESDILVYANNSKGFIMTSYFENPQYFYNIEYWGVEEAYRAFGTNFHTCNDNTFLDNYTGRIWLIDNKNKDLYNKEFNTEKYTLISDEFFETQYQGNQFEIMLLEK